MATPYITIGCPTTGGGVVQEGDSSFQIEGIPIACVGHKATCPLHNTVSVIISGDQYFKVGGKPAARAGDSLSCGCKLLPKQSLVVGDNGGGFSMGGSNNSFSNSSFQDEVKKKEINEIYWSYGDQFIVLSDKSRYFDDLNVHIKTSGYSVGEIVDIEIKPVESELDTFDSFTVSVKIDKNGEGVSENIFKNKKFIVDTEY
ncbi:PAAR domain-containing protein [Acinetobacter stercoris]|uniref:PAAR motif protein n=1 Tax=Acinetobacter stercoris TaxID=2126983 RepID=A0A2U3MY25_9GAMM|nr:PAAR domain-containing protein [Acinetobacter stercoris]SPL70301.1 PAAR motif protein [Acinetobacter stercoris]